MSLAKKLESTPHREVAGSDAYAAFEYQLMFGVELLFENFDKLDDYAVLFEFHDDLVLLTGATTPTEIQFFQLKHTTRGNWTLARLRHNPKKAGSSQKVQSILQKLHGNVEAFGNHSKNAQVVSNAYCTDFGQAKNSSFGTLDDDKKARLLSHIQSFYPNADDSCLSILGFRRTELEKTTCHELVKGRVHSFLQEKIGGDAFQLEACTNAIVTQCRLRNRTLATDVTGRADEIVAHKGISKADIETWLSEIALGRNAPDWNVVQPHIGVSWGFSELNSIRLEYDSYKVEALDNGNDAQNALVWLIRKTLEDEEVTEPLSEYINSLILKNGLNSLANETGYSFNKLKAMVIYEIYKVQQTGAIQEVNPQPEDEDK